MEPPAPWENSIASPEVRNRAAAAEGETFNRVPTVRRGETPGTASMRGGGAGTTAAADSPSPTALWVQKQQAIFLKVLRVFDLLFVLMYAGLVLRLGLALAGAQQQAGFARIVTLLTEPFYFPFRNILPRPVVGEGVLDLPVVLALLTFMALHWAVRRILGMIATAAS